MKGQSMIIRLIKWKRFSGKRANKTMISSGGSKKCGSSPVPGDNENRLADTGLGEIGAGDIKWEVRPGGMLVQKRDQITTSSGSSSSISSSSSNSSNSQESMSSSSMRISIIQISTASHWHDISVDPTATFGELKAILSVVTGLEPREQRLLYRGKQREDDDHLHMVGVSGGDKVLLLEDPALKDTKMRQLLTRHSSLNSSPHAKDYSRSTTIGVCSGNIKHEKENLRPTGWEFES